jgi:hypothetical protein
MKTLLQPVVVRLRPEVKQAFKEAAADRMMPLSTWLVQAGLSYLRSAKKSATKNVKAQNWPSGWAKDSLCFHCMRAGHDPASHAEVGAKGVQDQLAWMLNENEG